MDLRVVNNAVVGLPDGNTVFLLVKANLHGIPCFYAVFGPSGICVPEAGETITEMPDARVALFHNDGSLSKIHDVYHGHKYAFGGGMVNIGKIGSRQAITWTTPDECGITRVFGEHTQLRDVLIAL